MIWKGNPHTFSAVYGMESCFKILVSAVGVTKKFFNIKLYTNLVEIFQDATVPDFMSGVHAIFTALFKILKSVILSPPC